MPQPIRIAVVGAGYFSRFHFDGWARIPGVSLVAAADLDASKLAAMAQEFSVPETFASVEAMLGATACDVLDIATPPPTHAAIVKLGLARGLTVVCQKPFCTSLDEARTTIALTASAPDKLIIHENFRFEPWYRETKRLLNAGALGDIYQITFRLRPGDGQGPDAYLARQPYFQRMPRFLVRETAIHFIDAHILFTFSSGARGIFDGNRLADHAADDRRKTMGEMWIDGAKGTLRLDGFGRLWLRKHGENPEAEISFPWQDRGYGGDCVYAFQRHIAEHFAIGTPLETVAADYIRNLEIEDGVYRSHLAERRVIIST
jgi:D-apiose dehydrogenase